MANEKLFNFLRDDIEKLVEAINQSDNLQTVTTTGTSFDTLGDFASYWSQHLKSI